jgi:hypothetical protein
MTEEGTVTRELLALTFMLNGLEGAWLRVMTQLAVEFGDSLTGVQVTEFTSMLALNVSGAVTCIPPAAAVMVATPSKLDAATVASKPALVDPDATFTLAGTETFALLLESVTANPAPCAGPVKETVHVVDPGELTPDGEQVIELSCSAPATVTEAF